MAEAKGVEFFIHLDPHLPKAILTDSKRLQQVIKNLLSNAFKFTHRGNVALTVEESNHGWSHENETLNRAHSVIAITVTDTGIGISPDKQQIIFEAFQQADGSTSRKYGGTGLGLAISREIARLLGGEIRLQSTPGKGSSFTLYLPQTFSPPKTRAQVLLGRRTGRAGADDGDAAGSARVAGRADVDRRIDPAERNGGRPRPDSAGRSGIADRRQRPGFCPATDRRGARARFQGAGDQSGRGGLGHGPRIQSDGDDAGYLSARHRWLARARPIEE